MTVRMRSPVFPCIPHDHARRLVRDVKGLLQLPLHRFECHLLRQGKIQVLGEAVVREVTLLEGRPSLEEQTLPKRTPGKSHQEPGQAVVPLKDSLRDAAAAGPGQTIREKREIALGDHELRP